MRAKARPPAGHHRGAEDNERDRSTAALSAGQSTRRVCIDRDPRGQWALYAWQRTSTQDDQTP